ncbi:hypothetical protein A2U01_0115880, partial [Trifolium medium]|nr:hypothetical protein [Trifolium medium]
MGLTNYKPRQQPRHIQEPSGGPPSKTGQQSRNQTRSM